MGQGLKFSFVLCFLLGTGGCSSTEMEPDPNATVSGFCGNWAKAACSDSVVLACSGADKVDAALTDHCVLSQRDYCETLLPPKGYSSQFATQCLNAVKAAYSDGKLDADEIATVRHRGAPCNHLIKGAQAAGDLCGSDDECDTLKNYLCVFKSGEGRCQIPTLVDAGKSCSALGATCSTGYYCGVDEACVESKGEGDKCTDTFQCDTGLECTASKCVARKAPTSCTQDQDCPSNVCDIPAMSDSGGCVSKITLAFSTGLCENLR